MVREKFKILWKRQVKRPYQYAVYTEVYTEVKQPSVEDESSWCSRASLFSIPIEQYSSILETVSIVLTDCLRFVLASRSQIVIHNADLECLMIFGFKSFEKKLSIWESQRLRSNFENWVFI